MGLWTSSFIFWFWVILFAYRSFLSLSHLLIYFWLICWENFWDVFYGTSISWAINGFNKKRCLVNKLEKISKIRWHRFYGRTLDILLCLENHQKTCVVSSSSQHGSPASLWGEDLSGPLFPSTLQGCSSESLCWGSATWWVLEMTSSTWSPRKLFWGHPLMPVTVDLMGIL